jgi:hypothetical protein
MNIVINELEVVAPPPGPQANQTPPENRPPVGVTPRDLYWVTRKQVERQLRSQAR